VKGLASPVIRLLSIGAVLVFLPQQASGQATGSITGQVLDRDGQRPLPSVTVHVKGTGIGTLTNAAGRYVLPNVPAGSIDLAVQSIGYRSEERTIQIAAGVRAVANFTMSSQAVALDEIIVTGTPGGTQRRALGNDVSRVTSTTSGVQTSGPQTVQALLAGKATGVQVSLPAGEVGGGGAIKIRGTSSLTLGSDPILFVDGVRVNNSAGGASGTRDSRAMSRMNDFKPEDIESIEIIKGPAAATLYGTEASAGVIQIITKRGVTGRPTFEAQMRGGVNYFMNPEGRLDWNYFINPTTGIRESWHPVLSERAAGFPEWLQHGPIQDYQVSVRGGQERIRYYVAANHGSQEGYIDWNWFKESGLRANLDMGLSEKLDLMVSTSLGESDRRSAMVPAPYSLAGSWGYGHPLRVQTRGWYAATPEQEREIENLSGIKRTTASVQLSHTPLSWLKQRFVLGHDLTNEVNDILFNPQTEGAAHPVFASLGLGDKRRENRRSVYNSLDYSATARFNVSPALIGVTSTGFQYYKRVEETDELRGQNFAAPGLTALEAASVTSAGGRWVENASVGLYVQQQVEWRNRVFLTAAVRGDDNSAFGVDYNAAIYPKLSATWVLHEESFWHVPVLNSFRLRGAWGKAGRQPSTFAAVSLYSPLTGPNNQPALIPGSVGNPNLGPEVGEEIELGFDAGLLEDRIALTFTAYDKSTKDAMLNIPVASSTGFLSSQTVNLGEVNNRGTELSLNAKLLQRESLGWDLGFNIATNRNKIVSMGGVLPNLTANTRQVEGYPVNSRWFAYVVSAEWDRVNKRAINAMCLNAEGGTQPCAATGEADVIYSGRSPDPKWFGGINTSVTVLKDLRLFANVDFAGGHIVHYHALGASHPVMQNTAAINGDPANGIDPDPIVWWYSRHPNPAFSRGDAQFLGDYKAGFARLRDLSATYTLPDAITSKFGSSRTSVTLAARNLWFLWQETKEQFGRLVGDPEAGAGGNTGGTVMFYPPTSITASIRTTF
jgi:TonB-linked SusC/RagA family outer membrane protein